MDPAIRLQRMANHQQLQMRESRLLGREAMSLLRCARAALLGR